MKTGEAIFISNKIDFKIKAIGRDNEGHYIMITWTVQQEDITLVNIYAPNTGVTKNIKQILMDIKGGMNRNTDIKEMFNTPLTSVNRSSRQKINKETTALDNTLDQMYLIHIFRAFHPKEAEYTYFSSTPGMFSRIDHMLGHKTSLNKFNKLEIISSIFSDHNAMKLEINHKNTENTQRPESWTTCY